MTTLNFVREPLRTTLFATGMPRMFPRADQAPEQHDSELWEPQRRVDTSLQTMASVVDLDMLKMHLEDARLQLETAHRHSAAAIVQQQLATSREVEDFELAAYLRRFCGNLIASVIGDTTRIEIDVHVGAGAVSSAAALNVGLIVAEFVVSVLEHAFVADLDNGNVAVTSRADAYGWKLAVSDNGLSTPNGDRQSTGSGFVAALVRQLDASLETSTGPSSAGTSVSVKIAGQFCFPRTLN